MQNANRAHFRLDFAGGQQESLRCKSSTAGLARRGVIAWLAGQARFQGHGPPP